MTTRGMLWGVGLGPGDPELVTVKAARVIGEADVVAYHSARPLARSSKNIYSQTHYETSMGFFIGLRPASSGLRVRAESCSH